MPQWHNWSGKLSATPQDIRFARSEEDVCGIVKDAASQNLPIRCAGATHSHAPLVAHDGLLLDLRGLAGIVDVDTQSNTAWVGAGSRIHTLGAALHAHGLALQNQGDIDEQAICGATATGTHGTGINLRNLSSAVLGARIVLASGELVTVDANHLTELWQASRLHLGAFGVITQLKLQLREAYKLQEETWQCSLVQALEQSHELQQNNRHYEFFWYPGEDQAHIKIINETDAAPKYPLGEEGTRCAWNYEVLPNYRPTKHTEMEYSIPIEHGQACMRDIQALLQNKFPDVKWPVEYRTLAADDVWLSTAYQRDTVTISVHQDVRLDEEPYYRACEEIFLAYEGRPHWGKIHYLSADKLAQIHPQWDAWWEQRDTYDPTGLFLNTHLKQWKS